MENKKAIMSELSNYEKNFKYITESGLLYPNIDLRRRKRIVQIYNEVFDKTERISTTCRTCIKKYIKELAKWYYAAQEIQDNDKPNEHTPDTISNEVETAGEQKQEKPKKRGRKPKNNQDEENR